jgi:hypothetical protein
VAEHTKQMRSCSPMRELGQEFNAARDPHTIKFLFLGWTVSTASRQEFNAARDPHTIKFLFLGWTVSTASRTCPFGTTLLSCTY